MYVSLNNLPTQIGSAKESCSLRPEADFLKGRLKKCIERAHKNRGKPPEEWKTSKRFAKAFDDPTKIKPVSLALSQERYARLSRKTKKSKASFLKKVEKPKDSFLSILGMIAGFFLLASLFFFLFFCKENSLHDPSESFAISK